MTNRKYREKGNLKRLERGKKMAKRRELKKFASDMGFNPEDEVVEQAIDEFEEDYKERSAGEAILSLFKSKMIEEDGAFKFNIWALTANKDSESIEQNFFEKELAQLVAVEMLKDGWQVQLLPKKEDCDSTDHIRFMPCGLHHCTLCGKGLDIDYWPPIPRMG